MDGIAFTAKRIKSSLDKPVRRALRRFQPSQVPAPLDETTIARCRAAWFNGLSAASITRSILIASTFRSGSTFAAELIRSTTGFEGLTLEKFNSLERIDGQAASQARLAATAFEEALKNSPNGVLSSKLMWPHRNHLARFLGIERRSSRQFNEVFPGASWILVTRRDRFAQAVSFWRAKKTSEWHRYDDASSPAAPDYDFSAIEACYRELSAHERLWWDFFALSGGKVTEIVYEDLVTRREEYLLSKLDDAGLEDMISGPVPSMIALKRQSDDISTRYRDRFLRDLYRLGR